MVFLDLSPDFESFSESRGRRAAERFMGIRYSCRSPTIGASRVKEELFPLEPEPVWSIYSALTFLDDSRQLSHFHLRNLIHIVILK